MLISEEKGLLFIHIQKTGGSSIRRALEQDIPDLKRIGGTHDTALQARELLGKERYGKFYKVAFVRNPWSRLLSWYMMIAQVSRKLSWFDKLRQRSQYLKLWQYVHNNSNNFDEFIRNCTGEIDDVDGRKSFVRNQFDYVSDENGDLIVDHIGRYENLAQDAKSLFSHLELPNVSLPHENASRHKHYSAYYTDELADIVASRFSKDIDIFNYKFERIEAPNSLEILSSNEGAKNSKARG